MGLCTSCQGLCNCSFHQGILYLTSVALICLRFKVALLVFLENIVVESEARARIKNDVFFPALRTFFSRASESLLGKPFLKKLGLLPTGDINFLGLTNQSLELAMSQLTREALDAPNAVILPCADNEHVSKYQALYDSSTHFDKYREGVIFWGGASTDRRHGRCRIKSALQEVLGTLDEAEFAHEIGVAQKMLEVLEWRYKCTKFY